MSHREAGCGQTPGLGRRAQGRGGICGGGGEAGAGLGARGAAAAEQEEGGWEQRGTVSAAAGRRLGSVGSHRAFLELPLCGVWPSRREQPLPPALGAQIPSLAGVRRCRSPARSLGWESGGCFGPSWLACLRASGPQGSLGSRGWRGCDAGEGPPRGTGTALRRGALGQRALPPPSPLLTLCPSPRLSIIPPALPEPSLCPRPGSLVVRLGQAGVAQG